MDVIGKKKNNYKNESGEVENEVQLESNMIQKNSRV